MKLGPREIEVAKLLLQACSNKEIGAQLNMKERTVKAKLHGLYLKFGLHDGIKRVKLAVYLYYKYPEWRQ
jgi:DNA-binding NarL/FixJ family response regulator